MSPALQVGSFTDSTTREAPSNRREDSKMIKEETKTIILSKAGFFKYYSYDLDNEYEMILIM